MKKFYSFIFAIIYAVIGYGQSITLTPNQVEAVQTSAVENMILQSNNQPNLIGKRFNGNLTNPNPVVSGDDLLSLQGAGYNGSLYTNTRASIRLEAAQDWTSAGTGTSIRFFNTPNSTNNLTERMVIEHNGTIGIGISNPIRQLDILQDNTEGVVLTRYGDSDATAPSFVGVSSRGNKNNPTPTRQNDILSKFGGNGMIGNTFYGDYARIQFNATQNWGTGTRGSAMSFYTIQNGENSTTQRMLLTHDGKLGIGVSNPDFQVEVLTTNDNGLALKRIGGDAPGLFGVSARGSINAPIATLSGNLLFRIGGRGHNGTDYTSSRARIEFEANQDWTPTANGANLRFYTTLAGSTSTTEKMAIMGNGNVGIGEPDPQSTLTVNGDFQLKKIKRITSGTTFNALNRESASILKFDTEGVVDLHGIAGGQDGLILYIMVAAGTTLKIHNGSDVLSNNSLLTDTGTTVSIGGEGGALGGTLRGSAVFIYDAQYAPAWGGWVLVSMIK